MSFLAGRLAGKEGAYFFQESKHALNRLAQNNAKSISKKELDLTLSSSSSAEEGSRADVLPEVLRHSLPSKIYSQSSDPSSLSTASKWALCPDPKSGSGVSPDALNPLRAYVSLPQVTFGPKRWELPRTEHAVSASTANELRQDQYAPVNPEKLKAAAEGLANVGKAFAVATAIVFGGASLIFGVAASKLEVQNSDDLRIKGRDLVQPKFEMIKEQVAPLRTWAENMSKKWHLEGEDEVKQKPMIKELTRILGQKS